MIILENYCEIKSEVENFLNSIIFLCSEIKQVTGFIPSSSELEINSLKSLAETLLGNIHSIFNGKLVASK